MTDKQSAPQLRRKPKQARALAKYNAVLDACTQVLAEHGYKKTTILELSLASDVAVPTIYQYFPNKESIFVTWLDDAIDQILVELAGHATATQSVAVDTFILDILNQTLPAIDLYRDSIRNLFTDLPHVLVSHTLDSIQQKTTAAVMELVNSYLDNELGQLLRQRLQLLIPCILGFILQHVLIENSEPFSSETSEQLSQLALSYLSGVVPAAS